MDDEAALIKVVLYYMLYSRSYTVYTVLQEYIEMRLSEYLIRALTCDEMCPDDSNLSPPFPPLCHRKRC